MSSTEKIKNEFTELSKNASEHFQAMSTEVEWLNEKWRTYCLLFPNPRESQVLWEASELAYIIFLDLFMESFILTISRLTDKKTTGKGKNEKENSTIYRLIDDLTELLSDRFDHINYPISQSNELEEQNDNVKIAENYRNERRKQEGKKTLEKIKSLSEELGICTKSIRELRNKTKGHRDLNTITEEHRKNKDAGEILMISSHLKFQDLSRSVEIISELLKIYSSAHLRSCNAGTVFNMKTVEHFIENLKEGNKWRVKQTENMEKAYQDIINN